ncbi:TPA: hypothetical protein U5D21_004277 [Yersinia enterocolitica]|nr:hypothetical protein [Yersinia enterocolitica]
MKIESIQTVKICLSELECLDPVDIIVDDYELGKGKITIGCAGNAWTASWYAMSNRTVAQFIADCDSDYIIGCLSPQLDPCLDADNEANVVFIKSVIIKLRRDKELSDTEARNAWEAASISGDIKGEVCNCSAHSPLQGLLGDDPYYANWPSIENHHYAYLSRIVSVVKAGLTHG